MTLTEEETLRYLSRCVSSAVIEKGNIVGKTVWADSFEVAPLLPTEFVDLMIVDPPYNMNKAFGVEGFKKVSDEEYRVFTKKWIEAFLPSLKKNASVYVCCDWESGTIIAEELKKYFVIRNRITWQREKGRGAKSNWKNGMEDIYFCTLSDEYAFNLDAVKQRRKVLAPYREDGKPKDWFILDGEKYRDTCPSNFWDDITVPYWSMSENTPHPTQKPEKLLAKLILASSNEGDLVFDPFGGSGSTVVTAKKLGRNYFSIERESSFCALTEKRLSLADEDKTIQGMIDGVFYARGCKK